MRVALHVLPDQKPLVISCNVERGDDNGFALVFRDMTAVAQDVLAGMLDALPLITGGMDFESRLIVSEIVPEQSAESADS